MISTLEKEITFRFLKARKKDGFLNVISIFSFIGISLGVAVLIIVMSVMNGFRTELINKIVGFNPHITVQSYDDNGIDHNKLNDVKTPVDMCGRCYCPWSNYKLLPSRNGCIELNLDDIIEKSSAQCPWKDLSSPVQNPSKELIMRLVKRV